MDQKYCNGCATDSESVATDVLCEIKKQAHRWFVIALIELILICAIAVGGVVAMVIVEPPTTSVTAE